MNDLNTPGTPKRERNAVETRRRLLDSAEAEFAAKGFDGARLSTIARAAGVQQALIHHYFEDKSGIYRAVIERAFGAIADEGNDILGSLGEEVRSLVEAFADALVRFYSSHASLLSILRHEAQGGGSFARDLIMANCKPVFDAVVARIEQLARDGKVRSDVNARHLCISVSGMAAFPFYEEVFLAIVWPVEVRSADFIEARKRDIAEMVLARILPVKIR